LLKGIQNRERKKKGQEEGHERGMLKKKKKSAFERNWIRREDGPDIRLEDERTLSSGSVKGKTVRKSVEGKRVEQLSKERRPKD